MYSRSIHINNIHMYKHLFGRCNMCTHTGALCTQIKLTFYPSLKFSLTV